MEMIHLGKKVLYYLFLILFIILAQTQLTAASEKSFPGTEWDTINNPAAVGWSPEKIELAKEYADSMGSVGGLVIYDGKILLKWGNINEHGNVHSMRKSLLSALYGIYSSEGKIDLSSTLGQLGIDDNEPKLSDQEKQARIIDLLKARSGIYHPATYETEGMMEKRPLRWSHAPDTFWYYNNWDFNVLGTIFEKQTNKKIGKAFEERIAVPIQMQDFRAESVSYIYGNQSIYPAYPFELTARDMARFGLLYLRNGQWQGKQIIPSEWINESTKAYSDAGKGIGYGYLWWVSEGWMLGNKIDDEAYRADGYGGQFIVVFPSRNLVVVNLSNFDKTKIDERKQFGHLLNLILAAKEN
jgi:CubicO group peptidase (beta-lactamase class C family)